MLEYSEFRRTRRARRHPRNAGRALQLMAAGGFLELREQIDDSSRMRTGNPRIVDLLKLPAMPHRLLAAQLRQPSGRLGRWVMTRVLNRGNAELITSVIDALALARDHTFMDLGFGGGLGLKLAAARTTAPLWAVDFSPDVVLEATRTFSALIASGRMNVLCADVADLPLRDGLVHAICSTNTIYFWPEPARGLRSLRRVLRAGGTLALGYSGATKMRSFGPVTQHGFTSYEPGQIEALLRDAGFTKIRTTALAGTNTEGDYLSLASG
jgi:SAM-dependent methyltransferase